MGAVEASPKVTETTPVRGWLIFVLFQQMGSFAMLVSFTFGVMLPTIREDLSLSTVQAGVLASIPWAVSAVTAVPFGSWLSRFRPVRLVGLSAVVVAVTVGLQALATGFLMLFVIRLASVVFQAMQPPARSILMSEWIALRHIAAANGLAFAFHSVIQAAALSVMAVVIAGLGGWRETYVALGGALGLLVLLWFLVARERPGTGTGRPSGSEASFRIVLRYPQVIVLAAAQMAPAALWTALLAFLPTYLLEERDFSLRIAGLSTGLLYWGAAASGLLAGPAERLIASRRALIAGPAGLFVVGGLGVLLAPNSITAGGFALLVGLGWLMQPIILTLPFHLPGIQARELAVINGFLMMTAAGGFAAGPLLAGLIADRSESLLLALLVATALCFSSVILGLAYPRERVPRGPAGENPQPKAVG